MAYDDFADLNRRQSTDSIVQGNTFAQMADPFMGQRGQYQNQLNELMASPGKFGSSPLYKFAFDQGLDALNRRSAASGRLGSGNYLADLTKYGQGMAGQQFFNQANLLSRLAGVDSSSPAAAALSASNAFGRSQDQQSMEAAARNAGQAGGGQGGQLPWWMQGSGMPTTGSQSPGWSNTSGGANYSPGGGWTGGYTPTQGAGSGYMQSDFGTTQFGGGGMPSGGYQQTGLEGFGGGYGQDFSLGGGFGGGGGNNNFGFGGFGGGDDFGTFDLGGYQSDFFTGGA